MVIFDIFSQFPEEFPILETLLSSIVAFFLGVVWYNPVLMGKQASAIMEEQMQEYKPKAHIYAIALLLWSVCACVYSFLTTFLTPPTIQALLGLSTFLWVGFILPATMLNGLFHGKKLIMMGIDSSYYLAAFYLFAVIHNVI